jgi:hypothetical protein
MSGSTRSWARSQRDRRTGHGRSVQGDRPPSLWQVPGLLARFVPYYLKHFVVQPYRGLRGPGNVQELLTRPDRRHQVAVYDAVLELMLKGYAELAGHPLRPETGRVAVMLTRVGFAFDDAYESRMARQESTGFDDLMDSPRVRQRVREWRAFMQGVEAYDAMRDFLTAFVAQLYREYAEAVDVPGRPVSFETMLHAAALDSGGLLVALAHIVALLHDDDPAEGLLDQFSCVGVNGKLADDVIDFPLDLVGCRPNMLLALATKDAVEHARAISKAHAARPMSTRWWQRNCPQTYQQLAAAYEDHQARITSRWLAYSSRLMWTPALLGHARKKETRGRI